MTSPWAVTAVFLVCALTSAVGLLSLRFSRGTSDFYVAGRTVTPWRNASAIGGEYISAASFLGIGGLIYERGAETLWLPVGYTVGYLVLLVLVAAPLRRSGAYTLPDFAQFRLGSLAARRISSVLVLAIGGLYLVPQLQGAGLVFAYTTGLPRWIGTLVVALIVTVNVALAGMRSITLVQAVQYWLKLTAIFVPVAVLLVVRFRADPHIGSLTGQWWDPLRGGSTGTGLYATYSLLIALCLGSIGLPHVVVRFYTNPTGRDARRTTTAVLALLGAFYLWPPVLGWLSRTYLPAATAADRDTALLRLPAAMTQGTTAELLGALLAAGAFAAFLSTSSGLLMAVAGVLDQDVVRPLWPRSAPASRTFRAATVVAMTVPLAVALSSHTFGLSMVVEYAFALAASTFTPLVVLGVWWRGLSTIGAIAGMVVGGAATASAALMMLYAPNATSGLLNAAIAAPAACTMPLATAVMVLASLASPHRIPPGTARAIAQLHLPESVAAD
ncbi:sodium/solute symporter [Calidifontibacter terrae]